MWNPPSEASQERAYLHGEVDPAHAGQGVGRTLLAWSLTRAEERLRSRDHDLPRYVRVDAFDFLEDRPPAVRTVRVLARPLVRGARAAARPSFPPVEVPDGSRCSCPGRTTGMRSSVSCATPPSPITGARRRSMPRPGSSSCTATGPGWTCPSSPSTTRHGDVVALCLNHAYPEDDELTGRREAWIENLATVREWRKRGVASALIAVVVARPSPRTASPTPCSASTPTTPRAPPASTGPRLRARTPIDHPPDRGASTLTSATGRRAGRRCRRGSASFASSVSAG